MTCNMRDKLHRFIFKVSDASFLALYLNSELKPHWTEAVCDVVPSGSILELPAGATFTETDF